MAQSKIYKGVWYSECTLENFKKIVHFDDNIPNKKQSYPNQIEFYYDIFNDRYGKIDLFKTNNKYFIQITTERWHIHCDSKHISSISDKLTNVTLNSAYFTCEAAVDLPYDPNKSITFNLYFQEIEKIGNKYLSKYLPSNLIYKIYDYLR